MLKTIEYAYATSTMAVHFKRGPQGCYYVGTKESETQPDYVTTYGPFDSIEDAQGFADTIRYPFSQYSKRSNANSQAMRAVLNAQLLGAQS